MKYKLCVIRFDNGDIINMPDGSIPIGEVMYNDITDHSTYSSQCSIHGYKKVIKDSKPCCSKGKIENIPTITRFNYIRVLVPINEEEEL